ncbi:MAG: dihydrodipicolinate synthase family protein [Planctomyces sp.]|nr:dihydrodipicolinate synthase family protein [Planctomyces sp.]
MIQPLHGVLPILHTPFHPDDSIDRESLRRQIEWVFAQGADGVCTGMVSETLRMSESERIDMMHLMAEYTSGRGSIVASVGAESTKVAVMYAKRAEAAGCTALMAIPPVTTGLPEAALWSYFSAIADSVSLPLIVQDASSYVGRAIPVSFYVRLLDAYSPEKILFKPEASPVGPNLTALREASDGRARCFDGSGGLLLIDAWRRGIAGTMPGSDLLDGIIAIWRALRGGNQPEADRIAGPLCAIVSLQLQAGLDGFLAIEKYLMVKRGLFATEHRREPFSWSMDRETRDLVDIYFNDMLRLLSAGA